MAVVVGVGESSTYQWYFRCEKIHQHIIFFLQWLLQIFQYWSAAVALNCLKQSIFQKGGLFVF